MNTLSIVIFVISFEGEIKMAGVLQTVMDNFFGSIPEKQFEGFSGEKKDTPKKGLGTKPTVFKDVDFDAYEDMMKTEEKSSSVDVIAKHYADIIKEESKDPDTGEDRSSEVNNNVAYTKGVTTVEDVESQGFYVDKILRDNARDPSNRLGSTAAPLNKKEGYYNKIQKLIEEHNKETTFTPYVSSRDVYALEGPEASGPITKKVLSPLEIFRKRVSESYKYSKGIDPSNLANPRRGLMGRLEDTEDTISRTVIDLEGGEAGDYSSIPLDASAVQRLLGVKVDGKFGKNSKLALKAFQRRAGLPVTGEYKNVATQVALQQTDSSDPRNTAGFFDAVTNIPKNLFASKGKEFLKSQIDPKYTRLNDPLVSGGIRGNSRLYGDASQEVQKTVINKIILEGKKTGMTNDQIAMTLAIANVESGFNPDAATGESSATGIGQFIDETGAGYSIDNTNRWDLDTQVKALVEHTLYNYNLVNKRGKTDNYVYKYHHDGPTADNEGLKVSNRKVMPLVKKYKKLLEG